MAKVFVYTVPRKTATKISEVANGRNVRLNQTKITRGCQDTFMALPSIKTGLLNTGLDSLVENPYKDSNELPLGFEHMKSKDKVKEQHIVEIKYGLPFNYLSNEQYDRKNDVKGKEKTFYQTFNFKLNDGLTVLDTDKRDDYLAYKIMTASKRFANSKKDLDSGKFPDAIYYIGIENETEDIKFKKKQKVNNALAKLANSDFDSITQKKVVKILELAKGNLTDQQSYNTLSSFIEDTTVGKDNISEFERIYKLLETADGREEFEARYLLQDLIDSWIVSEKQGTYIWNAKKLTLGQRKEEAVKFLINPEKQEEQEELKRQLAAKKAV
jgi:hypothetical protein